MTGRQNLQKKNVINCKSQVLSLHTVSGYGIFNRDSDNHWLNRTGMQKKPNYDLSKWSEPLLLLNLRNLHVLTPDNSVFTNMFYFKKMKKKCVFLWIKLARLHRWSLPQEPSGVKLNIRGRWFWQTLWL